MQLATYLQHATSPDKATRDQAEAGIRQLEQADWAAFVSSLASELANESSSEIGRQMASVLLKNALDAKDSRVKADKTAQWKGLDDSRKTQIRAALLQALASPVANAAHGAAMAIAKLARIEILDNSWPELLDTVHRCVAAESPETTRVYGLQCLGYICEEHNEVADQFPQQETNKILTSIVGGMASSQPLEVKLYATKALCDALEFASMNFEKQEERDCIMQVIYEAAVSPDQRIRLAAYQNLNKVADLHYKYLEPYIAMIFSLTTQSFLDANDEVAMQAIEFWSVLAEIELLLKEEEEELDGVTSHVEMECKRFLERCATELVPKLLDMLTLQNEEQDDEDTEWNKCMAATVCLMNIAKTVKDDIFEIVKLFIQTNVSKRAAPEDWRFREAAITAFGCIVEGPDSKKLLPFANEAFGFLLNQGLQDEHMMVRRTTLWTLGRIFEFLHSPGITPALVTAANINQIVEALLLAMQASHGMAQKACYAVQALAEGFAPDEQSHALTPWFAAIIEALFKVAYAEVSVEYAATLHVTAFEAMHTVIQNSARDSIELVTKMIPHLLQRISETLGAIDTATISEDAAKAISQRRLELQGQLCTAMQVAIKRACAHPEAKQVVLTQHADAVMEALLKVQNSRTSVSEEVVMAMSVLCLEQGSDFSRYLQHIMPTILAGLSRHEDLEVCRICVNTVGDIAREVMEHVLAYADPIMTQLLANLQSPNLNREVKPDILQVFGDMAQGLGTKFDRYIARVVETLQAAMNIAFSNQTTYQSDADPDEALIIYNNELRLAIIQSAQGILLAVPKAPSEIPQLTSQVLTPFGRYLLNFVNVICMDMDFADEPLLKESVRLIGDLCQVPGLSQEIQDANNKQWITDFLQKCVDVPAQVLSSTEQQLRKLGYG